MNGRFGPRGIGLPFASTAGGGTAGADDPGKNDWLGNAPGAGPDVLLAVGAGPSPGGKSSGPLRPHAPSASAAVKAAASTIR
jgi:hypothetical protein